MNSISQPALPPQPHINPVVMGAAVAMYHGGNPSDNMMLDPSTYIQQQHRYLLQQQQQQMELERIRQVQQQAVYQQQRAFQQSNVLY